MGIPGYEKLSQPQQQIVLQLHAYYEEYGRRPLVNDLKNHAWCAQQNMPHISMIRRCFKCIDDALRAADVPVIHPKREDFVRAIQRFRERHGHMPTTSNAMDGSVDYSRNSFLGKHGFRYWSEALKATGYTGAGARRTEPTKAQLIEALQQYTRELGRVPTQTEVQNNPKLSTVYYYRKLIGPWPEVCKVAKLREVLKLPPLHQEMLQYLQSKIDERGRVPAKDEMRHGKFSVFDYEREFGSWAKALSRLGRKPLRRARRREVGASATA